MSDYTRPPGKTTVAPEVLVSIARLTALGVPGVNRLATIPSEVERFFSRGMSEGIKIAIENDLVYIDLYVILDRNMDVREISRAIQQQVARAVSELVGMEVGRVNIHIEDIDTSASTN